MDVVTLDIQVNGVGFMALIRLCMTSLSRYPIVKIDQVPFQACACACWQSWYVPHKAWPPSCVNFKAERGFGLSGPFYRSRLLKCAQPVNSAPLQPVSFQHSNTSNFSSWLQATEFSQTIHCNDEVTWTLVLLPEGDRSHQAP